MNARIWTMAAALVLASTAVACGGASSSADPGESGDHELKLAKDDLVVCKDAKGKKGTLRVFYISKASADESNLWHTQVAALGFTGRLGEERVEYSQGDQPDVDRIEVDGKRHRLRFLKKQCHGSCDNIIELTSGGGEDEEFSIIRLSSLTIDKGDKTALIEGETLLVPGAKPFSQEFQKCKVDDDRLAKLEAALK